MARSRRRLPVLVVAVLMVALVAAACGDDSSEDTSASTTTLGAAEPADSPEPGQDPAGSVRTISPQPEGLVYDPGTDILAVAVREATELVLIQGRTGEELKRVRLPGHARHLQLASEGGPVLVPAEDSDTLVEVSLPDGETTTTPVGRYPHDASQAGSGRILVADEKGGSLSVVEDGEVVHTFEDRQQPGGTAPVGEDRVGVVDVGDFTVSLYDVETEERIAQVNAGEGPTHLVSVSDDRLAVADTRGDALLIFGTDPLEQTASVDLPGKPYGITYDEASETVWVTLTGRNELVGIDVSDDEPRETMRIPTVRQANTVAVDPESGRLWTASRTTGELQTIDP